MTHGKRFASLTNVLLVLLLFLSSLAAAALDFEIPIPRDGLANTFHRLASGQNLRIAYLGGSVTEMQGWRTNTTSWFSARYPGRISDVNAGWSGTGSAIGAIRFPEDVLAYHPNLIFIEFAINDETGDPLPFIMQNMEGMVRQAWQQDPWIDICFIETISFYQEPAYLAGNLPNTVDAHYRIADHYGVPSVNVGWALYERVLAGTPWESLAPDRVHPNEAGHRIYSDALEAFLESERIRGETGTAHAVPSALTSFPIANPVQVEFGSMDLPSGWIPKTGFGLSHYAESTVQGSEISLSFTGPIAVLKFIRNPDGGSVGYSIDGNPFTPIDLRHDWAWIWAMPIGKNLPTGSGHSIQVRNLSETGVARVVWFGYGSPEPAPTPTQTPVPCPLISRGKPVTADSQYSDDYPPSKVTDGQVGGPGDRWVSGTGDSHWLRIDLDGEYDLCEVRVYGDETIAGEIVWNLTSYTIRGSLAGTGEVASWPILASFSDPCGPPYPDYPGNGADASNRHALSGTYRYIGVHITGNDGECGPHARVQEIQVYGWEAPSPTPTPVKKNVMQLGIQ